MLKIILGALSSNIILPFHDRLKWNKLFTLFYSWDFCMQMKAGRIIRSCSWPGFFVWKGISVRNFNFICAVGTLKLQSGIWKFGFEQASDCCTWYWPSGHPGRHLHQNHSVQVRLVAYLSGRELRDGSPRYKCNCLRSEKSRNTT